MMNNCYVSEDILHSIGNKLVYNFSYENIKDNLIRKNYDNIFYKESSIVYENILTENLLCRIHSYFIFTSLKVSNDYLTQNEIEEIQNSNLSSNIKNKIFLNIGIHIADMCDDLIRNDLFNEIFNINSLDDLKKNKDFLIQYDYYPHYNEYFDVYNMSLINLRKYYNLVNNKENIEIIWDFFNNNNNELY